MNIIIIGATSGIGRALFEKYASDGNCIGVVGRRTHLLNELRQEHPDMTVTATADITKQDETARAIDALHSELKAIDLAIVCSGTGKFVKAIIGWDSVEAMMQEIEKVLK